MFKVVCCKVVIWRKGLNFRKYINEVNYGGVKLRFTIIFAIIKVFTGYDIFYNLHWNTASSGKLETLFSNMIQKHCESVLGHLYHRKVFTLSHILMHLQQTSFKNIVAKEKLLLSNFSFNRYVFNWIIIASFKEIFHLLVRR